jgi:hypothetical protein
MQLTWLLVHRCTHRACKTDEVRFCLIDDGILLRDIFGLGRTWLGLGLWRTTSFGVAVLIHMLRACAGGEVRDTM